MHFLLLHQQAIKMKKQSLHFPGKPSNLSLLRLARSNYHGDPNCLPQWKWCETVGNCRKAAMDFMIPFSNDIKIISKYILYILYVYILKHDLYIAVSPFTWNCCWLCCGWQRRPFERSCSFSPLRVEERWAVSVVPDCLGWNDCH